MKSKGIRGPSQNFEGPPSLTLSEMVEFKLERPSLTITVMFEVVLQVNWLGKASLGLWDKKPDKVDHTVTSKAPTGKHKRKHQCFGTASVRSGLGNPEGTEALKSIMTTVSKP